MFDRLTQLFLPRKDLYAMSDQELRLAIRLDPSVAVAAAQTLLLRKRGALGPNDYAPVHYSRWEAA
jgi:hypothetical protein